MYFTKLNELLSLFKSCSRSDGADEWTAAELGQVVVSQPDLFMRCCPLHSASVNLDSGPLLKPVLHDSSAHSVMQRDEDDDAGEHHEVAHDKIT